MTGNTRSFQQQAAGAGSAYPTSGGFTRLRRLPLEADMIRFNDTLPPAQLRGVRGSTDKSLKRLATRRKDNNHYPTYFPTPDRVSECRVPSSELRDDQVIEHDLPSSTVPESSCGRPSIQTRDPGGAPSAHSALPRGSAARCRADSRPARAPCTPRGSSGSAHPLRQHRT